jgi:hypothetical protein
VGGAWSARWGLGARFGGVAPSLTEAVFLFVLLRVSLSVLAAVASAFFHAPGPCFHNGVLDWPTMPALDRDGLGGALLGVWERWDGCWYLRIATFGYPVGEPGSAFFPLYPALIRGAGPLFGGNLGLAALAVSGVGFVAAMSLLHALVRHDFGASVADRTVLYTAVFPTAFFFFAPFTESVFLALAVGSIYAARTRRFGGAAILGLLAGLTRPQGVLVALPLAWEAVQVARTALETRGDRWRVLLAGLSAVAPVAAFVAFSLAITQATGVSPIDAERSHWGYGVAPPWEVISRAVRWMIDPANAGFRDIQILTGLHLALIAAFLVLLAAGMRFLPVAYILYVAPQLGVLLVGGPVTPLASASRYMLVMFPVFVILARLVGERRRAHEAVVVSSVLGLGLLTTAIVMNLPVG